MYQVTKKEVAFDYQLRKDRAVTRNAIRLLHLMGYEDSIIEEAERLAAGMDDMKYGFI